MESFDVVIAGGAAMGSSTAWRLAEAGCRVLVVERDLSYAKAASALSVSSIRQQFSTAINIRVSLFGIGFLRSAREVLAVDGEPADVHVVEKGYLYLATAAGAATLAANHGLQQAEGADVALMDPAALKARFPWIETGDLAAASWGRSGEGWFDGYGLTQAYRRKARSLGAVYRQGVVSGVDAAGGRVTHAALEDGTRIACGAFVNACGASGARRLAQATGFDVPVHSRKRCVFTFRAEDRVPDCPLMIDTSGVYVRPEGDLFLCGVQPPEERDLDSDGFDVDWGLFEEVVWPALAARVPAFERIRPGRAWAGHYDMNLFDHNAIVGRAPGLDNSYLACGFSGHGMQQSPAVGRGLAELIVEGRYTTLDLSPFAFERIAAGRPIVETNVI